MLEPRSDPPPPADNDETLLVGYVQKALEMIEAGATVSPTELCKEHPELAASVAQTLGLKPMLPEMSRQARALDPYAGRVLRDRYRLETRIGMGAMGLVYLAEDQELRREVAVKILEPRLFREAETELRFLRESEILATLAHDHVVGVHDRGHTEDGTWFLVMDHVKGASLATVLETCVEISAAGGSAAIATTGWLRDLLEGEAPPEQGTLRMIVRLVADLASGLRAAHDKGVFHRDVKPSNVIVRPDYRAVLLDFGIAVRADDQKLTLTETVLGTPWYMAPEQAQGAATLEPTTDVYGLTATLYHMLTLRPPFEGDQARVLVQLQTTDPTPASRLRADLPRDLSAILEKGMERNPRHRYQTMAALEADLRAFLDHRPVSVRPLSNVGRFLRGVRRSPARSVAVVATAAAVLFVALVIPIWMADAARQRAEEKMTLWTKIPSLLAIEGLPDQRLVAALTPERTESIELLDRILELDAQDLPVRLWRAALHLDAGNRDAAAADLRQLAANTKSAYVAAVAARYLRANPDVRGTESIDLAGLPEPTTAEGRYVAGFHELRNRHVAGWAVRGEAHLAKAMATYEPARDLRLIALLAIADRATGRKKYDGFKAAHEEAIRLEGRYGRPTARTLATQGAALTGMGRYEEAIAPLEASLELRPGRHGPTHNLGVAHRQLGDLDKAQAFLIEAGKLRPHFWNTTYTMAQVRRDRGEFVEALRVGQLVPAAGPGGVEWKRPYLLGDILQKHAITEMREGRTEPAQEIAGRSVAEFDAAMLVAPKGLLGRIKAGRAVALGIREGSLESAATNLLSLLEKDPTNAYTISNLATLLPEAGLGKNATWILRIYLRKLAATLGPKNPRWQELMQAARNRDIKRR